jgi:hypothetical protein
VALVIGVSYVLGRSPPLAHCLAKLCPVTRSVHSLQRQTSQWGRIQGPFERKHARFVGQNGSDHRPVLGGLHVEQHILAEAHVDMFPVMLRLAPALACPILALGIRLFYVHVLHVPVERGVTPGNVFVVALDDEGYARRRYPRHMETACLQVFLVPDVGNGVLQMHVIGKHCFSADRMGAADGPFVGATPAAVARV